MQGQRGQDFETAARGRHSFRFLGPRPNDRLSHPVKEAAYRAAIHLNPQRGVERLAHFLQAALGIALMRAPQERLRLGGEFATISLTPPVQETGEALGRQAGLVTKILWPTKGHRVSAEKLVHGQIGSSDLFYHRCDLLGSAFPAGRGPVHPPQHSLNMAIWPACSAVFVRSWGIKRYNWTMLFRGEDSSSSWLLIISSTDSFLRARESRSYVELRSGPVSANCNSPKYQTIVMYYLQSLQGTAVIAYHRHAAATGTTPEQFLMIFLNFADSAETVTVPFPKAGTWKEMIDADLRVQTLAVPADGANKSVVVPSNYGCAFLWPS